MKIHVLLSHFFMYLMLPIAMEKRTQKAALALLSAGLFRGDAFISCGEWSRDPIGVKRSQRARECRVSGPTKHEHIQ
jgi:hypothetical protein